MKEKKKTKGSDSSARKQAEHDIVSDPDLQKDRASDNLDEGELARKDNSDEKAFDALERNKPSSRRN